MTSARVPTSLPVPAVVGTVTSGGMLYLIPPGPFNGDTDAAAAGVPVGAAYRDASGVVICREV